MLLIPRFKVFLLSPCKPLPQMLAQRERDDEGKQTVRQKKKREIIKDKLNWWGCQLKKIIFVQLDRPPFVQDK